MPDTNHLVLTSGYGNYTMTGLCSTNDYVTAAATPDGSLMLAYLPANHTVTVNHGAIQRQYQRPLV